MTQTEEVQCVVAPDHLHNYLVDDIPNDPYCTPGFITAFRLLSPLREPVYAASARTLSGSLAEMERIIGETLFSGYVGYNGRAPGSAAKKEELSESGERNKSGGDARHTLVAYFEIVELASILCVDRETTNLAIRTFRHTANNTSLRNRNVESLATAAFVSAAERRWMEYQEWLKEKNMPTASESEQPAENSEDGRRPAPQEEWPTPPRHLTVEEISAAANLDTNDVLKYLKVVHVALRKQRPENSSSITAHMPTFCRRLDLPEKTRNLAIGIAEKAMQNNICSRRNPPSISAAAIYLACQLDGIRKTQMEICRATPTTEVTLRKVHKELVRDQSVVTPDWYNQSENQESEANSTEGTRPFARPAPKRAGEPASQEREANPVAQTQDPTVHVTGDVGGPEQEGVSLVPPPLPPGFGKGQARQKANQDERSADGPAGPQPQASLPSSNPMVEILNNPAMQAFANAFAMMPQFNPPPPPAPPPLPSVTEATSPTNPSQHPNPQRTANPTGSTEPSQNGTGDKKGGTNHASDITPASAQTQLASSQLPSQPSGNLMAGMQSMMNMVHAMQAFQTMQNQAADQTTAGSAEQLNPIAMMAMAMAQAQSNGTHIPNNGAPAQGTHPVESRDATETNEGSSALDPETQDGHEQISSKR